MKLVVERTGGFGGLKRRGERNGEDLSSDQRIALDRLLENWEKEQSAKVSDSKTCDIAAERGATGRDRSGSDSVGADRFVYRISIEDENGTRSITIPEAEVPKELKDIVL
jgi:hypothetical protein